MLGILRELTSFAIPFFYFIIFPVLISLIHIFVSRDKLDKFSSSPVGLSYRPWCEATYTWLREDSRSVCDNILFGSIDKLHLSAKRIVSLLHQKISGIWTYSFTYLLVWLGFIGCDGVGGSPPTPHPPPNLAKLCIGYENYLG